MVTVKATEINNKVEHYLQVALKEPVVIENASRQTAVLISMEEYKRLTDLDDADRESKECIPEGVTGSPCAIDIK